MITRLYSVPLRTVSPLTLPPHTYTFLRPSPLQIEMFKDQLEAAGVRVVTDCRLK